MNIEQFRKAGYQAIDRICDYYSTLQERPVKSQVEPGYLRKALPACAPETGEDFEIVADDYQKLIVPGLTHWQHPSFFAYFPAAGTFESILADLYSTSAPNPGFTWSCSPACTELEAIVMDWAAQLLGLNPVFYNSSGIGGGVIQTCASDAVLTSVVAARITYLREYPDTRLEDLLIYTTTQTHSLGTKGGLILGIPVRSLQVTAVDNYRLRGETLRRALEEDTASGKRPFFMIATIGTTSSGAIDDLTEIEHVVQDYPSLWVHVDAAWAGMALSCPENRQVCHLDSLNRFVQSFCTSFHKWGLTNLDASTLWVRDRSKLTNALDITPEFLRTKHGDEGTVIEYRNWHLALGRRFRSLKVWFVLRGYGVEGVQEYIRRTIKLNNMFISLLPSSKIFSLVAPPSFALSVFRIMPKDAEPMTAKALNDINRQFYERISNRNDIMLTQTQLNDIFCIRFAVGAQRTTETHIQKAFDLLCVEAEQTMLAQKQSDSGATGFIG